MDSQVPGATQSFGSNTPSRQRRNIFKGILLSILLHVFCFYTLYAVSKKVFQIFASREKVFRFTLIGEIPGEKKARKSTQKQIEAREKTATQSTSSEASVEPADSPSQERPDGDSLEALSTSSNVLDVPVRYPRLSRILGEEGEVVFGVDPEQSPPVFRKIKSSGHRRLDQAAEKVLDSSLEALSEKEPKNIQQLRFVFKLKETATSTQSM